MNTSIVTKKNIVIVGQGAIGLLCYHHLQQAKNSVTLLSSNINLETTDIKSTTQRKSTPQLNQSCYWYTAYHANEANAHPLIYAQIGDIKQADIIIFCVKSYQVINALISIIKLIKTKCLVILSHNGMGTLVEAERLLPAKQRILAMLTTHGCLRSSALNITHTGLGQSDLGLLAGSMTTSEKNDLTVLLDKAFPRFTFEPYIEKKQWQKLAINCVINPITALYNIENGQVNLAKFIEIKEQLITEVVAIAKAEGIEFSKGKLTEIITDVAQKTGKNSSSMRCDLLAKRKTEVNYINGYVHRLGIKHGITTPLNTQMWHAVKEIEDKY